MCRPLAWRNRRAYSSVPIGSVCSCSVEDLAQPPSPPAPSPALPPRPYLPGSTKDASNCSAEDLAFPIEVQENQQSRPP